MRPIDADKLLEKKRFGLIFKRDVRNAATIDPEGVRHARWEQSPRCRACVRCSGCKGVHIFKESLKYNKHNYCYKCGAKMDLN